MKFNFSIAVRSIFHEFLNRFVVCGHREVSVRECNGMVTQNHECVGPYASANGWTRNLRAVLNAAGEVDNDTDVFACHHGTLQKRTFGTVRVCEAGATSDGNGQDKR
ncbi:hypothetical protein DO73_3811 [Burkholderia pseudomallei]|nr:hypothetical protein DO73_3811 [Burkholderia pseudomallei]